MAKRRQFCGPDKGWRGWHEAERVPHFTVEEMQPDDIEEATAMRLRSWIDTYVNDEAGVTHEWIMQRNYLQAQPEKQQSRHERFLRGKQNGTFNAWVVRDSSGRIIGSTTPFIDEQGVQHVGSLYVDKNWHGTGVASELMQKVVGWLDPQKPIELGVATYNERAKAFYRKWGFEEVSGSERLFDDTIPEVKMIRKGNL
jgi:GNAT superfamily N-acetyltransferase